MLHPRIQTLFRMLDQLLPTDLRAMLDDLPDAQYRFEYDTTMSYSGTLTVYLSAPMGPGKTSVHVEREWFNENCVWFRKNPHRGANQPNYEAYVEYVSEYRDDVVVDLAKPLFAIAFNNDGAVSYEPIVSPRMMPVVQAQPALF